MTSVISGSFAPIGTLKMIYGTFTNAATETGGTITTGLSAVFGFSVIPTSHVGATMPKYSVSGGTVTLSCDTGLDGNWSAWGI